MSRKHLLNFCLLLFCTPLFAQTLQFNTCSSETDPKVQQNCNLETYNSFLQNAILDIRDNLGYYIEDSISFSIEIDTIGKIKILNSFHLFSDRASATCERRVRSLEKQLSETSRGKRFDILFLFRLPKKFDDYENIENVANVPEIKGCENFNKKGEAACFAYLTWKIASHLSEKGYKEEFDMDLYIEKGQIKAIRFNDPALQTEINDQVFPLFKNFSIEFVKIESVNQSDLFFVNLDYYRLGDSLETRNYQMQKLAYLRDINKQLYVKKLMHLTERYFEENNQERKDFILSKLKKANLDTLKEFKIKGDYTLNIDSIKSQTPSLEEESEELSANTYNFAVVEKVPVFKGCNEEDSNEELKICFQQKILKFISKQFKFPEEARMRGIQGKIYVNFVIEKDASVSSIRIVRGVNQLLDFETIRIASILPNLKFPATIDGKPVRMSFTLPINAKLQ